MKQLLLLFFLMAFFVLASGQTNYAEAMKQGNAAFDKKEYKKAINLYFAAEAFDPSKKEEVKAKVNKVFDAIDALRKKAEDALIEAKKQTILALEAKEEAEKQKDTAFEAELEASLQKDIAQEALKRNIEFQEKSVGKKYRGGIIFYADSTRSHGLIAAEKDLDSTHTWAEAKQNCAAYTVTINGVTYNDWHLPTKEELQLLLINREAVGGFTGGFYWSATEDAKGYKDDAMGYYFSVEAKYNDRDFNKGSKNRVRAVRAF